MASTGQGIRFPHGKEHSSHHRLESKRPEGHFNVHNSQEGQSTLEGPLEVALQTLVLNSRQAVRAGRSHTAKEGLLASPGCHREADVQSRVHSKAHGLRARGWSFPAPGTQRGQLHTADRKSKGSRPTATSQDHSHLRALGSERLLRRAETAPDQGADTQITGCGFDVLYDLTHSPHLTCSPSAKCRCFLPASNPGSTTYIRTAQKSQCDTRHPGGNR